jgi:hypothetical protein
MAIRKSRSTKATPETSEQENITVSNDTPNFDEPTTTNDIVVEDPNFDVDAPEAEDVVAEPVAEGTADTPKAKEKKESTRPPVPEGKVSPVAFAKILTEHLRKEHESLGKRLADDKSVAPQVVYSYIKNNAEGSKNPFPATKAEGRAAVVDAEAGLAWWDAKDVRVAEGKKAKAEKDAAKAAKAANKPAEGVTEAEAPTVALEEAE